MNRPALLAAASLLLSTSAWATVGGPNSFQPLGVDNAGKVYLREDVGGESGMVRLWVLDPARPSQPTTSELKAGNQPPPGLRPLERLALNELRMTGEIVRQSLQPQEELLVHRFDLKVTVAWKSARTTVDLVGFKTAQVRLVDGYAVPQRGCAVAFVSTLGKPEESGYDLQKPVMLCGAKPDVLAPTKATRTLKRP